jgi:predicted phage replisome organizer
LYHREKLLAICFHDFLRDCGGQSGKQNFGQKKKSALSGELLRILLRIVVGQRERLGELPNHQFLRRLPEGNNIVLIWVMLLTMAGRCNAGGMIFLTENIPYTPKMLADELDFEENTVSLALNALEQLNMVVTNNGHFTIAGWEEYQNIEGMDKIRESKRLAQARWRAKQKELPGVDSTVDSTRHLVDDADKEEDKDIEEEKNKRETTLTLFERLLPDYIISPILEKKLTEWFKYKTERKEPYKEQGMKTLLRQIENNVAQYGNEAVCHLIDDSMANGWKGIIFDRLKKPVREYRRDDAIANRVKNVDNW